MKKLLLLLLFCTTASFSQINLQPIPPYTICEYPYDGESIFILNMHTPQVLGSLNPQLYSVAYFQTLDSSQTNTGALPNQYISGSAMIAVRVWENSNPSNYDVGMLELRVDPAPPMVVFEQLLLCQEPMSGNIQPVILNTGLDSSLYTFQWMKGTNVLPDTSNTLTVTDPGHYTVQVTSNTATGCYTTSSAFVMLSGIATASLSINIDDVVVNATGPGVYEYRLDNGPIQDSPVFADVTIGQHSITVIDTNGCGNFLLPFEIISNFANNFNGPNDLYGCTTNGSIPATFDLTVNDAIILNGSNPNLYTVTYHNSDNPAQDPTSGIIDNPQQYTAIVPNQVLRAMVVENANPVHKAVYDFLLVSGLQPLPGTVTAINFNDNDNDGQAIVDLTTTETQIFNGQSATVLSITYHISQQDAENGLNPIAQPSVFYTSTRTIYFRVTYFGFCNATGNFQVNVLPALNAEENVFKSLKYYPNPAQNIFTITNNAIVDKVEIYSITGQLVKSEKINTETLSLNIADLQNGIYMVKVSSGNAEKTIKMVKQ